MRYLKTLLLILFLAQIGKSQTYTGNLHLPTQEAINNFPLSYPNVKRILGYLILGTADTINLSDIMDLHPLSQLTYINTLYISNNGVLTSVDGLEGLDTLNNLVMYHNPNLQNVGGFQNAKPIYYLAVRDNDKLENLEGFSHSGNMDYLEVRNCPSFKSFEGLDSAYYVFYTLVIQNNDRLTSIAGLNALEQADFLVEKNDSLLHFGYFPSLEDGSFRVVNNKNLIDFKGFNEKYPEDFFGLSAFDNPKLESFAGLEKARKIGVFSKNNAIMTTVTNFDSLRWLQGFLLSCPMVDSIYFPKVERLGGFTIYDNPALKKMNNVFPELKVQESFKFEIYDNPSLKEIVNMMPVADSLLAYRAEIYNNDSLLRIHEDVGPRYIENLAVYDNDTLGYVTGFEGLEGMGSWMEARLYLSSLHFSKIEGFNHLKKGSIFIEIPYESGHTFESIEGFHELEEVYWDLLFGYWSYGNELRMPKRLKGFDNLKTIHRNFVFHQIQDTVIAFQNLETIGNDEFGSFTTIGTRKNCYQDPGCFQKLKEIKLGDFGNGIYRGELFNCPSLERVGKVMGTSSNVDSFTLVGKYPLLTHVGGIYFVGNKQMRSLDGLEGITHFKKSIDNNSNFRFITLEENDSLSDCSAICYLMNHAEFSPSLPEPYTISNPLFPCNDVPTVMGWCDTLSTSVPPPPPVLLERPGLRVYPNPVTGEVLYLESEALSAGQYPVQVSDASGQRVMAGHIQAESGRAALRVSALSPGWYALQVGIGQEAYSLLFLKMEN